MHHPKPSAINETLELISHSRLSSYKAFFNPKDDYSLYGIYCWNDALSSCFMRIIGVIEVSLRNRLHTALSNEFWNPAISIGTKESNDWYNHLNLPPKSVDSIKKITHTKNGNLKSPPPTCNTVIAGLTYGFWTKLLEVSKTRTGASIDWGIILPKVLPSHHQAGNIHAWSKQAHRDAIYVRIETIGNIRNRVAHFEPMWKLGELKEEKRKRAGNTVKVIRAKPMNSSEAILHLKDLYQQSTQLLHWLSAERAMDYSGCENHARMNYLLSEEALTQFQQAQLPQTYRLGSLTKAWGLKMILRNKAPTFIKDKKVLAGIYYPLA